MIQVGKKAPSFKAEAIEGGKFKQVSLEDYRGKYVVLFFYPLDFTFVCPTEITAFSDKTDEFTKANTQVLGCSVDSKFSHLAWTQVSRNEGGLGDIKFPLIADITKKIAKDYNVLIKSAGVALRGAFIIDPNGVLKIQMVNDLSIGRNVDEVLRLVKAVQFTDQNGEVCPANWNPGDDTMIPDPAGSKKYFSKHG